MINHLSNADFSALQALLSGKVFSIPANREASRGFVRGLVNFELVKVRGFYLIERTYIPLDCWKQARRRYVSLEAFINEYSSVCLTSIDDLPW